MEMAHRWATGPPDLPVTAVWTCFLMRSQDACARGFSPATRSVDRPLAQSSLGRRPTTV